MKIKLVLLLFTTLFTINANAQKGFPFDAEVRQFKHQDSLQMPAPGGILFVGSSSIRLWDDLEKRFEGKPVIKRGLGGSELWQWVEYYTPYVLFPYQPKKVFIYAGENDIASGRTAQNVAGSFEKLWTMIHDKLPNTEIYFLSIKPSPSRAKFLNEVILANNLIKAYADSKPKTKYIDVATPILNKKTMRPDSSLFKGDYLHLNSKGYDKWEKVLKKYVK
ncbi:GDSL-type esterase/lipase family protein [Mucilaginibacter roseus]|uniref:GDSL-type esterase/lipase family protein n=1 Tax=Mucilaginibacter roseus TaxID=1528868 RepID=A0ABS8U1E5_9SPHI|nr:GDSL-type esterase/lipase family protein [Mucilaginibacter roseus]MCD8740467.1 GDSL-type esterase/lipase family protein [Mucilaginibacter roseus]